MGAGPFWTDDEIGLCLDYALSVDDIVEITGRGRPAVKQMRNKLRRGYAPNIDFGWTDEQRAFVRNSPNFTDAQVARHLGRTTVAVKGLRKRLGIATGSGQTRFSPFVPGHRVIICKTCKLCGLLLDAQWFGRYRGGRIPYCSSCVSRTWDKRTWQSRKNRVKPEKARANLLALQSISLKTATRNGLEWLSSDHVTLSDRSLTVLEKAIQLERTYFATVSKMSLHGYSSKRGKGEPTDAQWLIDNPNAPKVAA